MKTIGKKRKQTPGSKAFGCLLFSIGFSFLIWNEFKIVSFNKLCSSTLLKIKPADIYKLDTSNDGELIYLTGAIHTNESLVQLEYGISIPAVVLKRRVQMYQWIEVEGQGSDSKIPYIPSETSYSYRTDWRDKLIDSSKFSEPFGHQNPTGFPLKSETIINENVCIGIYCLSDDFKLKFSHFTLVTSDERPERRDIKMHAGLYYHTADVWNPVVGDTRIQFSYAGTFGDIVSLIGTQEGAMVNGKDLVLLAHGKVSPDEMIYNRHNKHIWIHRIIRIISWVILYSSSFYLNFFIMILKTRYHKSTNFFTMDGWLSVNFSVSSLLTVATISLIWIHFSPWMSTSIWLIALCPLIISSYLRETNHYTDDYMQLR